MSDAATGYNNDENKDGLISDVSAALSTTSIDSSELSSTHAQTPNTLSARPNVNSNLAVLRPTQNLSSFGARTAVLPQTPPLISNKACSGYFVEPVRLPILSLLLNNIFNTKYFSS